MIISNIWNHHKIHIVYIMKTKYHRMGDVSRMKQAKRNFKQKIISIILILFIVSMGMGCDVNSVLSSYLQKINVYNNENVVSSVLYRDLLNTDTKINEKIANVGTYKKLLSILNSMNVIRSNDYSWKTDRVEEEVVTEGSTNDKVDNNTGYSQTNVQVSGVDEADIIKNDGKYLYYLNNGLLSIFDTSKEQPILVSKTQINNNNNMLYDMYICGDILVLCGWKYEVFHNRLDTSKSYANYSAIRESNDSNSLNPFTVFAIYDISNRNVPNLKRMVEIEGEEVSTRLIGNNLYFITNKQISYISGYDINDYEILPMYKDTAASTEMKVIQPDDISYFPGSKETQYLLIGTFDITKDDVVSPQAYLGSGSSIYMNTNSLYISKEINQLQVIDDSFSSKPMDYSISTEIYRFAINGMNIEFAGIAKVDGRLINQYSMDEYNGILRVASGNYSDGNGITTIDISTMNPIASITGLAVNERIYSVRFMGNVGYMVTYRNVDPLFVFDLSNPENPLKTGELKIPGFSQYLHPVGNQYLVGFGRNTQEQFYTDNNGEKVATDEVIDLGFKLSLFDVSDLYNPKEVFVKNYAEGSYSPVSYDPHSVMVDAKNNIFAFPISDMAWTDKRTTGTVIKVTDSSGLTTLADIDEFILNIENARFSYTNDKLYFLTDSSIAVFSYPECKLIITIPY